MDNCGTTDIGYCGSKFTWCNNRNLRKRIWKRLDRVFVNDKWTQKFQNTTVKHLVRTRSDHMPLLMKSSGTSTKHISYFKFLKFWTKKEGFFSIVKYGILISVAIVCGNFNPN
ncbi:uncharacterized protein [Nicotiana tomentosiformis]|uniref:uncharacterized protein n=1 Tax=Nicotiana tomentosiformis TaxID=4098 RepID=UPI00388C8D8A